MQYEQPSAPNAPTLFFTNHSKADVAVLGFADAANCKNQINISKNSSRYMDLPSGKSEQIKIRADEAFSFLISMRAFPKECFMVGTLTPSPSMAYSASILYDGRMCRMTVKRVQDDEEVFDKAFVPRVFKMPFSGSYSACADTLPQSQP